MLADCPVPPVAAVVPVGVVLLGSEVLGWPLPPVCEVPPAMKKAFQPAPPYWKGVVVGGPCVRLLRRYQLPAGLTTPRDVSPVPLQSPTTGVQPGAPYWIGP